MARPPRPADAALIDALAARAPASLIPVWLEVARRLAARRRPAALLDQRANDAFVAPSPVDQRTAHRFDGLALAAADAYEALLLAPLAPLGACSVVSPTNQDRAIATSRGTEVVSDPTNVMAIEAAARLRRGGGDVRLCTVHQVTRPQRYGRPGHTQHFRMLALVEAGAARADHGFEIEGVLRALAAFLRLLDLAGEAGCRFGARRLSLRLADRAPARAIGERLRPRLAALGLAIADEPLASGYYDGVRLLLDVETAAGTTIQLADIGLFDWVARLTSNRRMRLVAAGLGLQLLPLVFDAPPTRAA